MRISVKEFGKLLSRGDTVHNLYTEHGRKPYTRNLEVIQDVPGRAFFILQEEQTGKIVFMRTKTLRDRYEIVR